MKTMNDDMTLRDKPRRRIRRFLLIALSLIVMSAFTGCGKLKQTETEVTVELGETFRFDVDDYFDLSAYQAKRVKVENDQIDTGTVGDYEIKIAYGGKGYTVTVHVVDSVAPVFDKEKICLYTNQFSREYIRALEGEICQDPGGISDLKPQSVVRLDDVRPFTEEEQTAWLTELEKWTEASQEEASLTEGASDSEDIGLTEETSEGIYGVLLEAADKSGNKASQPVIVVYDVTAPVVKGISDMEIEQLDVTAAPDITRASFQIEDNCDGVMPEEAGQFSMEETQPGSHIYEVHITCGDRAGNTLDVVYKITVVAPKAAAAPSGGGQGGSSSGGGQGVSSSGDGQGGPSAPAGRDDYAEQVLAIINQERANNGLAPVSMNYTAVAAAKVRARELVSLFSHSRPDGSSCFTALDQAGVSYWTCGENIAAGQRSPEAVMRDWMESPGHRANILDGDYTQVAVACYYDPGSSYGYYWVQLFIG